ncbi:MAG: YjgP/YjgQ family permease [Aphanocapsa feldmannii 277cV]|uniref:YjgP/YjgQ family permease n=2 Tax=Aphanocapsa feldmannii TaxID=192050 RepID=A0A524RL59_9CHRO|nr:MAG: YjgP/YjgQ family permease [Aphanocapsa feldmannii 288cV]TGG90807.1 MAG: YjgP/YjgQ family permease [Aphanocapsa feldmannii 277cV]TGH27304.1 MAG: YjgP/YjgQ family permease [Aphanocapsa feldmannii 277cI]
MNYQRFPKSSRRSFKLPLSILDSWLLGEMIPPLIFGISIFTVVSLSAGVLIDLIRKIVEKGLHFEVAIRVFILNLPGFLVLSLPMATLLATLMCYSKLSSSNELVALRSLGVSRKRTLLPAIAIGLLMMLGSLLINDSIAPAATRQAKFELSAGLGKVVTSSLIKDNKIVYPYFDPNSDELSYLFHGKTLLPDNTIQNVTLLDFTDTGRKTIIQSETAKFDSSSNGFRFSNGTTLIVSNTGDFISKASFQSQIFPIGADVVENMRLSKNAENMSIHEARIAEKYFFENGELRNARKLRVRIHEKLSIPAACLVFAAIGSVLGSRPNRLTSKSQGFGLSVLLIFTYYLVSFSFSALGVNGTLPPLLAAWAPVVIGLATGGWLLHSSNVQLR